MGGTGRRRKARTALEMLERCHGRIAERLERLERAAARCEQAAISGPELADEVADVAAFMARTGRRHELDEELSLFPRLRKERPELEPLLETLTGQHREHARLEAELTLAASNLDGSEPTDATRRGLRSLADRLSEAYAAHIELEDRELLPAAQQLVPRTLGDIAREMQARRGR